MNSNKDFKGAISFDGYRVIEINYNLNDKFKADETLDIDINFRLGHGLEVIDNTMIVSLGADIFSDPEENNYPFSMRVILEGMFTGEDGETEMEKYLPNALSILFPYVRSIVSTYTSVANISPLNLPTINIIQYLKDAKNQN
ncbi:protein translocase subunit secB [Peptoniphilus asaccharolyticus DSM 20463]|uniref:Protein translocase subunit secB n=1 Tax=Peptoniphilus asaccharolyticus DSM 20463 TaxID=573058 RepID=A0A1W1V0Y9_PEPAS|nr:protein-export chaperone SecB [Peptoniphilus asaccharolyticus]MBL7575491.1 protein-export chaperone SecB [Peptoniphilus asaccharolyticus]SMB86976.1 protein translocase subunit secB [Peptoniphilus asaccharolyticus DSM 20463]